MTPKLYPQAHLLGVPAEIRNSIYQMLFGGQYDSQELEFLTTCRQIYLEAGILAFEAIDFPIPMGAASLADRANRLSITQKAAVKQITLIRRAEGGVVQALTELCRAAIYPTLVSYEAGQQLDPSFLFRYLFPTGGHTNNTVEKPETFIAHIFEQFFVNTRLSQLAWTGLIRRDEGAEPSGPWTVIISRERNEQMAARSLEALDPYHIADRVGEMEMTITHHISDENKRVFVKHKLAGELLVHAYSELM